LKIGSQWNGLIRIQITDGFFVSGFYLGRFDIKKRRSALALIKEHDEVREGAVNFGQRILV